MLIYKQVKRKHLTDYYKSSNEKRGVNMIVNVPFVKVILLRCNVFESFIEDERNFNSYAEAKAFADLHSDLVSCIIEF